MEANPATGKVKELGNYFFKTTDKHFLQLSYTDTDLSMGFLVPLKLCQPMGRNTGLKKPQLNKN